MGAYLHRHDTNRLPQDLLGEPAQHARTVPTVPVVLGLPRPRLAVPRKFHTSGSSGRRAVKM